MDKLSKLLRLGASKVPHIKGNWFAYDCYDVHTGGGKVKGACALGLMTIGLTGKSTFENIDLDASTSIKKEIADHNIDIYDIVNLNDNLNKSPEEIAQWLEEKGA